MEAEEICSRPSHTWHNGSKVGGLAGVTPRVGVGSSHCGGSQPAVTPACAPSWAPGVPGEDSAPTCKVAGSSGGNVVELQLCRAADSSDMHTSFTNLTCCH